MRFFALPEHPQALLFDLDSTLYTNPAYADFQNRSLIARLARERGESYASTTDLLARLRTERRKSGAGDTSLGNLFADIGIDLGTSVLWREELFKPEDWLTADKRLGSTLDCLAGRFKLALVTNNPRSVGEKSLAALGVRDRFDLVIGLDDSLHSKPNLASYELAAGRLDLPAQVCVSIGDRYDVDIAPALELGMGAILVDGVEDVYRLPECALYPKHGR